MRHLNKAFALPSIPMDLWVCADQRSGEPFDMTKINLPILQHVEEHLQRVCVSVPRQRKGATYRAVLSGQIISNSLCSPDRWWKWISCLHSHASDSPHPWLSVLHNSSVCVTQGCIWGCARGPVTRRGCAIKRSRPTKSAVVPLCHCLPH